MDTQRSTRRNAKLGVVVLMVPPLLWAIEVLAHLDRSRFLGFGMLAILIGCVLLLARVYREFDSGDWDPSQQTTALRFGGWSLVGGFIVLLLLGAHPLLSVWLVGSLVLVATGATAVERRDSETDSSKRATGSWALGAAAIAATVAAITAAFRWEYGFVTGLRPEILSQTFLPVSTHSFQFLTLVVSLFVLEVTLVEWNSVIRSVVIAASGIAIAALSAYVWSAATRPAEVRLAMLIGAGLLIVVFGIVLVVQYSLTTS